MRHPQLLVYETDGLLARRLEPLARAPENKWSLRELRQTETCVKLLRRRLPTVLVLKLGRDVVAEFELLDRVCRLHPEAAAVVVGDTEDPALEALAWDLGADYVLFPPRPREPLPDIVAALMKGVTPDHA